MKTKQSFVTLKDYEYIIIIRYFRQFIAYCAHLNFL